jgi:hypothetical protein
VYPNALTTAPSAAPCGCGCNDSSCTCSDPLGLERTRFFPRMLIGPDELTQDQTWIRDRFRRHNRMLHGWGIVCGCDVTQATDAAGRPVPWKICVSQGDVLGPCGDEIVVDCPVNYDVRAGTAGEAGPCAPPADPWCVDVRADRSPRVTYYLAIRYHEYLTRPVRTLAGCGCGCDDAECEYSRIRESFTLGVIDTLPASYQEHRRALEEVAAENELGGFELKPSGSPTRPSPLAGMVTCSPYLRERVRPCPPCPADPWVILADFTVDDRGVLDIDPISHRRYVASFAEYFFMCGPAEAADVHAVATQFTPRLRKLVAAHIDAAAMQAVEAEGDPTVVTRFEMTALRGVTARSKLGRFLAGRTIGGVASTDRTSFVAEAEKAKVDTARAAKLWDAASDLTRKIGGG